jgi:hypothetical protein
MCAEIISLVFIHTKYGEPIVIMDFRRTMQNVLCLSPPCAVRAAKPSLYAALRVADLDEPLPFGAKRKVYRVGPNREAWPNTLTENPY